MGDKEISSQGADIFSGGGDYGNYKLTTEEVLSIVEKIKERTPSKLGWKEFRDSSLIDIIKSVKPEWKGSNTKCVRAARVIYGKLREIGVIKDERDGATFDDGVEVTDEDAEEMAGATGEKDEVEDLTPTQEAIYNYVANAETSVSRKDLDEWIKNEFGYDQDGDETPEKLADAKMDLTALLASKILFKQGSDIVAKKDEVGDDEETEIGALDAPIDDEESFVKSYLGKDKPRPSVEDYS